MNFTTRKAISFGYLLAFFLFRPGALGQNFASVGLGLVLALTSAYLLTSIATGISILADRAVLRSIGVVTAVALIYLLYESAIALSFGESNLEFHFKETILAVAVIFCYGVFLAHPKNSGTFFNQLTTLVSFLGWSSLVTLILAYFFDLSTLKLFQFHMAGYEAEGPVRAGTVYFPFSMVYANYTSGHIVLLRFNNFFREAGIYQAVAASCLVLASLAGRRFTIRAGLVIGIICAFSTIGIAMLFVALGSAYFLKHRASPARIMATCIFVALGAYAALNTPIIGLADKIETHGSSLSDRTIAIDDGIRDLKENPLGKGQYREGIDASQISLLAGIGGIGIVGFLLQFVLLSGWRGRLDRPSLERMAACLPILLTAVVSQPIAGSAMIYVLAMMEPWCMRRVRRAQLSGSDRLRKLDQDVLHGTL